MSIDPRASKEKLQSLWRLSKELAMKNPNTVWRSPASWDLSGSLYVLELKNRIPSEFAKEAFENNSYVFRPFDAYSTIRISPNITTTDEEIEGLFGLI